MVGSFLSMIGAARFSSSLSCYSSSISSILVPLMIILDSWLLVTIAGEVYYHSTVVRCSFTFASCLLMGWYFIVQAVIVGGSLVLSLRVIPGISESGLGDCMRDGIGVLIAGTIESCGVRDSISFLSNLY